MSDAPEINGKPAAKVNIFLKEHVGLKNYSSVEYGGSITRFVEDTPAKRKAALAEMEGEVEGWMKDYYRDQVEVLLDGPLEPKQK